MKNIKNWNLYIWHIIAVAGLLLVQILAIFSLLLERKKRAKAEKALSEEKAMFENKLGEHIAELGSRSCRSHADDKNYRLLAEKMTDVLWVLDPETMHITYASPSALALYGFTMEEIGTLSIEVILLPEERASVIQDIRDKVNCLLVGPESSAVYMRELEVVCKDGSMIWLEVTTHYGFNGKTGKIEIYGISRNIQKRKQAEIARAASEERLRITTNNLPLTVYQLAGSDVANAKLTFISENVREMWGCSPEEAMNDISVLLAIIHPEDREMVHRTRQEARETSSRWLCEYRVLGADGQLRWHHGESIPCRLADGSLVWNGYCQDITERKLLKQKMSHLERLQLIGEMAAGIAHEIRNPMTTVRGFLQFLLQKKELTPFSSHLDSMITELDRVNAIITEYLSLAKNKTLNQSVQNVTAIIENLLPLMESDALLAGKWIVTNLAADIPDLLLDAQEIRQLILNFVRNGLEAMAAGGTLTVGTFPEGEQVVLYIKDQGKGIPAEVQKKIGTPFVTTKEDGTGLGLAICYNIAARHKAKIDVQTGDAGTTFMVKFPLP